MCLVGKCFCFWLVCVLGVLGWLDCGVFVIFCCECCVGVLLVLI